MRQLLRSLGPQKTTPAPTLLSSGFLFKSKLVEGENRETGEERDFPEFFSET